MGILQTKGDLPHVKARIPHGEGTPLPDQFGQIDALGMLHHEVEPTIDLIRVEDGDDIGVVEPVNRLHLS